jgi:U3 small nucleolar RNA-associated protein 19
MPSSEAAARSKRKRDVTSTEPNKKSRASPDAEMEDPSAEILLLEKGILESRKNYNDITKLLATMASFEDGEPESMLAAVALCRIFVRLLAQGSLTPKKKSSEKEATVVKWLRTQLGEYQSSLIAILKEDELASTALTLCMRLLKAEGDHFNGAADYQFPHGFLNNMLTILLTTENEVAMKSYIEEYVEEHDDIRYFTFKGLR